MIRRLWAAILARIRPAPPPELGRVVYAAGACRECGETSAVLDGRCWYCRTGNVRVVEPMTWTGPD